MKSEHLITLLLTLLIGYLTYQVMFPFFIPIFWAIVFVILFHPYYKWLQKKLGGRKAIASVAACLSIALFLIIPMIVMAAVMTSEFIRIYQWAENYIREMSTRAHRSPIFVYPFIEKYLGEYVDVSSLDFRSMFANSIKDITSFATDSLKEFIKNFASFFINLFLAFFSMYFLFIEGDSLLELIKGLLPLPEKSKDEIIEKNRAVLSSTFYGGVLVGAVQGGLGGLAFWALGLPAAVAWGFVMFLFSFLPTVGTAMIWVPAAVYLAISGSYIKALLLVAWGVLVIGLIDNIMRPYIVSGKTKLHPLLLLFSILGAVNAFGFIGIIAGPLILSLAQSAVEIYQEYLKKKNTWAG